MNRQQRCLAAGAVILAVLAPSAALADGEAGTVSKGTVKVQRAGKAMRLTKGDALRYGDIVSADAGRAATLDLTHGWVGLSPEGEVEIVRSASLWERFTTFLKVLGGQVLIRVRPGGAAETPSVTAGADATEFHLSVEADGTTAITVLSGEAQFFNSFGTVLVGASEWSEAQPGSAPTAPITVENPALMMEWTLDLERAFIPREKFHVTPDRTTLDAEIEQRAGRARAQPADPEARRAYGEALFDDGHYEEALAEFREADRLAPNQAETLTRIGDALLELGELGECEEAYAAALTADAQHTPALIGQAWLALRRDLPEQAQTAAEGAVAAAPDSAEAQIALGLALMRQPADPAADPGQHLRDAAQALQAAGEMEPEAYRYQARAWLALAYLAQDDRTAAEQEAQAAVALAPQSSLAHANLALVAFFADKPMLAEREAQAAVRLSPESVAAQCVLGQTALASGDVDQAVAAGARAVAFDPSLAQAHYLLGIAHAQRRSFEHASRELEECLSLAPDFLPAASALARVYTNMGREADAIALLQELLARHPESDGVLAALGQTYYQQARYEEAAAQYQEAVGLRPNSGLYHGEMTRVLLDANRLNEAINAGQKAVRLAPDVAQYHANLGLAYDFSGLSVQAERQFREALALDPRNALAHLVLGLKAARFDPEERRIFPKTAGMSLEDLLKQGLRASGSGPATGSIAQASLYDPAISTQVMRGGIDSSATLAAGNDEQRKLSLMHRSIGSDGATHSLGLAEHAHDDGMRPNDDTTAWSLSENTTFTPDPRTDLFARASYNRTKQGLAGHESAPDLNDRARDQNVHIQLVGRRRLGRQAHAWAGVSHQATRLEIMNPDRDTAIVVPTPGANTVTLGALRQELDFSALVPEVRLEVPLNRSPGRPSILTLGATYARLDADFTMDLFFPSRPPRVAVLGTRLDGDLWVGYAELTQRVSDRLSLAAQLRHQRLATTRTVDVLGGRPITGSASRSYWLPSLVVNYQPDDRTMLRLLANRQAQGQDLVVFALAPLDTLLVTEPLVMPKGFPEETRTVELDVERYLGPRDFAKLFLFRTTAREVDLGDLPTMQRVARIGWGARYERQLSDNLYGQVGVLFNRTTNRTEFAPFNDGTAPYHPPWLGGVGLNYVDRSGTKIGLQVNHTGRFYEDTGDVSVPVRPIFPAQTYVDLTLAKEPSVHREYFLRITNLFDSPAIEFNGYPTGQRRVEAGASFRF